MSEVKIEGLAQLEKNIKELAKFIGDKKAKGVVGSALRTTGNVIKKDARRRAPIASAQEAAKRGVAPGGLRDSIIVKTSKQKPGDVAMDVTIRSVNKKYASNKNNTRSGRSGKDYRSLGYMFYAIFQEFGTSTMPGKRFMTKAFEENKSQLPEIFRKNLAKAIERKVKKLHK